MDRLVPLNKRVPWQVSEFSTSDIEIDGAPATPKMLVRVFEKSVESFKKAESSALEGNPKFDPFVDAKKPGFGTATRGAIAHGLQLRLLDRVGLIDPDDPKVYSGGKAFELIKSDRGEFGLAPPIVQPGVIAQGQDKKPAAKEAPDLETRLPDMFEAAGIVELKAGKETFVRTKDNVVRMLGALRASDMFLKCHNEKRKGDLLGAFSYTFVDSNGTLKKMGDEDGR